MAFQVSSSLFDIEQYFFDVKSLSKARDLLVIISESVAHLMHQDCPKSQLNTLCTSLLFDMQFAPQNKLAESFIPIAVENCITHIAPQGAKSG